MSKLQDRIVDIALSQVGIQEKGGNNQGLEIRKYLESTWMPPEVIEMGFPWCSAFVTWVCMQARVDLGLTHEDLDLYIGAKAYDWEDHAHKNGWGVFPEHVEANPGDLVTFDFSHIGIVIADDVETIETVEGNTNGKGERDSESGDGVWQKRRKRSLAKCFIRLPDLG